MSSADMGPVEAICMDCARRFGGRMYRGTIAARPPTGLTPIRVALAGTGPPKSQPYFKVQDRLANWVVELEAPAILPSVTTMAAVYETSDGFFFKLDTKGFLHDFLGRLFGSKDADVGDVQLANDLFVKANDAYRARVLFANEEFRQNILERLSTQASLFRKLEARPEGFHDRAELSVVFMLTADVSASSAYAMSCHEMLSWLLPRLAAPRTEPETLREPAGQWRLMYSRSEP